MRLPGDECMLGRGVAVGQAPGRGVKVAQARGRGVAVGQARGRGVAAMQVFSQKDSTKLEDAGHIYCEGQTCTTSSN